MTISTEHPLVCCTCCDEIHYFKIWNDDAKKYDNFTPEFFEDLASLVEEVKSGKKFPHVIYENAYTNTP